MTIFTKLPYRVSNAGLGSINTDEVYNIYGKKINLGIEGLWLFGTDKSCLVADTGIELVSQSALGSDIVYYSNYIESSTVKGKNLLTPLSVGKSFTIMGVCRFQYSASNTNSVITTNGRTDPLNSYSYRDLVLSSAPSGIKLPCIGSTDGGVLAKAPNSYNLSIAGNTEKWFFFALTQDFNAGTKIGFIGIKAAPTITVGKITDLDVPENVYATLGNTATSTFPPSGIPLEIAELSIKQYPVSQADIEQEYVSAAARQLSRGITIE